MLTKKIILLSIALVFSFSYSAQILITDADLDVASPLDCAANAGPIANFFDTGNSGSNYGNNEDEDITVCPDYSNGSNKLGVTFGTNTGLVFGVHASDTVFVYDGPNTTFPLLGAHNSDTDPTGFTHQSTFAANPTGCLTFAFKSDGTSDSTGWEANIACLTLFQPFTTHMIGQMAGTGPDVISPSDTGYIDICLGDTVLFSGFGNFPYDSNLSGHGYPQDSSNVTYEWNVSDGTTSTSDRLWVIAPARNGYLIELKITDSFGQIQSIISKVRVSTVPDFSTLFINPDTVCLGDSATILGGVTSTDTSGVNATSTSFQLGGSVAGQVYLPDGSGVNHDDVIAISGFPFGQLVTAASDVEMFFLNIEHSYLGDLELMLTCPSGVQVNIFNSYSGTGGGSLFPSGFNGGNTFLGDAYDNNIGVPGVGMDYSWSTSNATFGTMATEHGNGNTIPVTGGGTTPSPGNAMNPNGVYLPETSFASFIGCPLNGDWKITVRDNIGADDGYIFEWGVFFDPSINPNNEVYFTEIVSHQWLPEATIVQGNPTDTFIVVSSNVSGDYNYTFEVTDNFGCVYDTTAEVHFLPPLTIPIDDTICDNQYQVTGTTSHNGGVWTFSDIGIGTGTATFTAGENPLISVDQQSLYEFTFTDNQCGKDTSFKVSFVPEPTIQNDDSICDAQYQITGTTSYDGGVWTYTGPGTATFTPSNIDQNPLINVSSQGTYTFIYTDNQCSIVDSFHVEFVPVATIPTNVTVCAFDYQVTGSTSFNGGTWAASGPGNASFIPSNNAQNPNISVTSYGTYDFTFTDSQCGTATTFTAYFPSPVSVSLTNIDVCIGEEVILDATSPVAEASYLWSNGYTTPSITVTDSNNYEVIVTGLCNSETAISNFSTRACEISSPNVFTPNGDGENDALYFEGLEEFPGSVLVVFSRWGQKIYENNNYQNDWSPTNLSDGTYFFILTPGNTDDIAPINSSITIFN
jgi:gliding motility-associated-like protein